MTPGEIGTSSGTTGNQQADSPKPSTSVAMPNLALSGVCRSASAMDREMTGIRAEDEHARTKGISSMR